MKQRISFVLRVNEDERGRLIRGQIEHVPTGKVGHFQNMIQAETFIRGFLPTPGVSKAPPRSSGEQVSSIFSFLRKRAARPEEAAEQPSAPTAPDEPALILPPGLAAPTPTTMDTPTLILPPGVVSPPPVEAPPAAVESDEPTPSRDLRPYVSDLLDLLRPYLPPGVAGHPPSTLSLASLGHRSLGIGGRRGLATRGGVEVAELRGGWLDILIRFDLWGPDPDAVNTQAAALQSALLADSPALRRRGLLRLTHSRSADAELSAAPSRWRRTLDYAVLYEYQFEDTDGAASLIARIPIHSETDFGAPSHEVAEVRDWMVRWDNEAAPALEIAAAQHGAIQIAGLSIAAFLPGGGPDGHVIQAIRRAGATVTSDFDALTAFLAGFQLDDRTLKLVYPPPPLEPGETQEIRDFQVGELRFDPPILLKGGDDHFRLSFSAPAFPIDNPSQVYIRALARR